MAQHDYNIANQSGADFRADLNNALSAIVTVNSGATEPSTTFAHQLWVDTANSVLKIRNAADNAWYTTGISITASNTLTGNLTGNVVGNVTGNLVGNVTGDLTGNADTATTLATARTISLSGDVVGSASFDGSGDITITTTAQIDSIALGTDTTGDYVQSISGGTGVTVTGGTGEGSTPSVAIGQAVATTDNVTFNLVTATDEFVGDIDGAIRFTAKADEALSKGDVVYVSGVQGNNTTVGKAKADDASKMPAFGLAIEDTNANNNLQIVTFGNLTSIDTSNESVGEILYVSTTAGEYTTTAPSGESAQIQNIGKILRSHQNNGSIKVGGAGRSNATPNLNDGKIFIGNASNQSSTATLDTSIVVENTNLYYTTARANTDFDTRLATKDTGDLTEGTNLYYTTARVNSDFDTRLATKSTTDLAEGTNLYYTSARFDSAFTAKDTDDLSEGLTNLYYTTARFDSAFGNKTTSDLTEGTNLYYTTTRANSAIDTRVTKAFVDALGIQASSVDANSVTLGTDTVGNYIQTITGTANKITVTGSGSESADVTLTLPDDVQIADSLTVAGNLTVNGTLTSLDTTNLDIEDNLFQLNAGLTGSPVNDSGMLINRGTADNGIFMWDESVDKFTLGLTTADGSATGNITLNSLGTLVANIEGDVTGAVTGTVSSLSNHDTGDLAEGTNLYYTQARFDSAFTAKSTSDLSEGTNLYYTDARFDTRLATKDTDDISEGATNLYYTTARFNSAFSGKSTSDLSEGSNLYYTDARVQAVSINNVVEDTTPQLGGNLDLNSSDITGTGDINITGTITSSGNITGTLATAAQPNITSVGTLTGLTTTGDINFGDNDKATFGAGSDLQIYHDGSFSYVRETGTGDLRIAGASNVQVWNSDIDSQMANFANGGAATLYYAGAAKIATTSTGIDVTGTAVTDGLTATGVIVTEGDAAVNDAQIGRLNFTNTNSNASTNPIRASILAGRQNSAWGGYLSLYTSTGTSAASEKVRITETGRVGIGTSSPSHDLTIQKSGQDNYIRIGSNSDGYDAGVYFGTNADWSIGIDNSNSNAFSIASGSTVGTNPRVTINSSGNVGIGTTSPSTKLDVAGSGKFQPAVGDGDALVTIAQTNSNAYVHAGVKINAGNTNPFYIYQSGSSNTLRFNYNSLSDAGGQMVITDAGNVGIGTSSPVLDLQIGSATAGVDANMFLAAGSNAYSRLYMGDATTGTGLYAGLLMYDHGNDAMTMFTSSTERLRIDSSGNVGIGITSQSGVRLYVDAPAATHASVFRNSQANFAPIVVDNTATSGTRNFISFRINNTEVGKITSTGSSTTYATTSDYRAKENVVEMTGALDRVNQLQPKRFNFISDADTTVDGFLAHEVSDIVPEAITGEKDATKEEEYEVTPAVLDDDGNVVTEAEMGTREVPDYQGIDQSKLVPLLTKAIQEQQELINNLTARIEQLEN